MGLKVLLIDEIQQITTRNLTEFYLSGKLIFDELYNQNSLSFEQKGITTGRFKLTELDDVLRFMRTRNQLNEVPILANLNIGRFENFLQNELTFLFYLNMNIDTFLLNKNERNNFPEIIPSALVEKSHLGEPKFRLQRVLAEDNQIKKWFGEWIERIIDYRSKSVKIMNLMKQEFNS